MSKDSGDCGEADLAAKAGYGYQALLDPRQHGHQGWLDADARSKLGFGLEGHRYEFLMRVGHD